MPNPPKVMLIVMDGWGHSLTREGNAILNAKKPTYDSLWRNYPHTLLSASGEEVGLPWGELGGSEVGHLTIGSGRVIYQNLPKITRAINDKTFFQNEFFIKAIAQAETKKSNLHLIGLVSSGGVHSHINHLEAILKLIKLRKFKGKTFIHMITDGRDTAPKSAHMYLQKAQEIIKALKLEVYFATVSGRYYSMDRDHHWDRNMLSYQAMVQSVGLQTSSAEEAINQAYSRGESDEFIKPTVILNKISKSSLFKKSNDQTTATPIKDKDSLIFFNFRPDRMRQIVELFLFPRQDMPDKVTLKNLYVITMTNYNESMPVNVAFPLQHVELTLAKILSQNGLTQLHIAETEKYAHVTYFFNGGNPEPNPGEKWQLIPSPPVATFDLKPEMSASGITDYVLENCTKTGYDFVLINFANADMVGHTGNYDAAVKAVETVDLQLKRLTEAFPETFFIIIADHGNAEEMINPQTGEKDTGHSINPVPFIAVHPTLKLQAPLPEMDKAAGLIADVTPTILDLLGLPLAPDMTGTSLMSTVVAPTITKTPPS